MGGASKASQSGLCKSTIGLCERHNRIVRRVSDGADAHSKRQLEVLQKAKRTGPGRPGTMRFEQGLLPCQFTVRCWLPVFSDGRLGRGKKFSEPIQDLVGPEPLEAVQRLVQRRELFVRDAADLLDGLDVLLIERVVD